VSKQSTIRRRTLVKSLATRTLPTGTLSAVTFAAVSCTNYPADYFDVCREIARGTHCATRARELDLTALAPLDRLPTAHAFK